MYGSEIVKDYYYHSMVALRAVSEFEIRGNVEPVFRATRNLAQQILAETEGRDGKSSLVHRIEYFLQARRDVRWFDDALASIKNRRTDPNPSEQSSQPPQ
jgi:hypothetical protein